jgi:hypothetical protein
MATKDKTAASDAKASKSKGGIASKLFCRKADTDGVVAAIAAGTAPAKVENAQSRVFGEAEVCVFCFTNGETRPVEFDGFNADVRRGFLLYGISQKLGDAYALNEKQVAAAEADGMSKVEKAVEEFDSMLETLLSGAWAVESTAGPRVSLVLEAWERAAVEAGLSGDALVTKRAAVETGLRNGDAAVGDGSAKDYKTYVLSNKKVAAAHEAIKAERAAERAAKAAAAAEDDSAATDETLF